MGQGRSKLFRCHRSFASARLVGLTLVVVTLWATLFGLFLHGKEIYSVVHGFAKTEISFIRMRGREAPRECTFPRTDPFDPGILKVIRKWSPLDCSKETANIVFLEDYSLLKVNVSKLHLVISPGRNFSHCWYKELDLLPNNDRAFQTVWTSKAFNDSVPIQTWHEHLVVECFDDSKTVVSRSYFSLVRRKAETERVLAKNYQTHLEKNRPSETLSIFVIGIDGMSKQNFERAMPKTRRFLLSSMSALEFHKHGKVEYSTFPNLLALLTGRTGEEFHSQYGYEESGYQDQINWAFLWSEARGNGYRTGLTLDQDYITAFHYLKKGFRVPPVDYYQRATVVASCKDSLMRAQDGNCLGDTPEITQLYDYWTQMASTFGKTKRSPVFAFSFAARLTHDDCDRAAAGDDEYLKFLQDLRATGGLNNTVLVWFSDHGQRYGANRKTYHGRIETNTPFLFFTFPYWFKVKYPEKWRVLTSNQRRLTSHFDVYETLRDLLHFNTEMKQKGTTRERGISLFRNIPPERTCANAGIPEEFCACGHFSLPDINEKERQLLGEALLDRINSYIDLNTRNSSLPPSTHTRKRFRVSDNVKVLTSNHTSHPGLDKKAALNSFSLNSSSANSSAPALLQDYRSSVSNVSNSFNTRSTRSVSSTTAGLRTSGESTTSGFLVSSRTCSRLSLHKVESVFQVTNSELRTMRAKSYRVTIGTSPGGGLFEGLVNSEKGKNGHVVGDVVRINMYRGQAECVHDPWLRQFCYCV